MAVKSKGTRFQQLKAANAKSARSADALATKFVRSGEMPTAYDKLFAIRDGVTTPKGASQYIRKMYSFAR